MSHGMDHPKETEEDWSWQVVAALMGRQKLLHDHKQSETTELSYLEMSLYTISSLLQLCALPLSKHYPISNTTCDSSQQFP